MQPSDWSVIELRSVIDVNSCVDFTGPTVNCYTFVTYLLTYLLTDDHRHHQRTIICRSRFIIKSVLICSLAVLDPRVGHTMDVLSPFIPVLCHSDWLFHGESCLRLDVVHSGRVWSSSPTCTWHCSLHYLFLHATPSLVNFIVYFAYVSFFVFFFTSYCRVLQFVLNTVYHNR